MTTDWAWFPKRFGPGDIAGEGALKLLGKPVLDTLQVLVRETVQNSWDARLEGTSPLYQIDTRVLSKPQLQLMRDAVFKSGGNGTPLQHILSKRSVSVIEISDRRTTGLGGPVRNDVPVRAGRSSDYVSLVLTMGAARDKAGGAGTYGFGKTISYLASSAQTILIWTHAAGERGRERSRLCASAIGDSFVYRGRNYTGRQWWGESKDSDSFSPFMGKSADRLAEQLFNARFNDGETGTSIMIIAPNLRGGRKAIATDFVDALVWNAWPKLLVEPGKNTSPMEVSVLLDGIPLALPNPLDDSRVSGYARALSRLRALETGHEVEDTGLTSDHAILYRGTRLLGNLAIDKAPSLPFQSARPDSSAPYEGLAHHVALMRHTAEFVVEYRQMPALSVEGVQVSGVFRSALELDDEFAQAEPPAHDAWIWSGLEDRTASSHIRTAERHVLSTWRQSLEIGSSNTPSVSGGSTARIANRLRGLLAGLPGTAARKKRVGGSGSGGGRRRRPGRQRAVEILEFERVDERTTKVVLKTSEPIGSDDLNISAGIGFDGGTETDRGAVRVDSISELSAPKDKPEADRTLWEVRLTHSPGIAVDVRVDLTANGGSQGV